MAAHRTVNPCRPGLGASCALCCGSHNHRLPPAQAEELFSLRRDRALRALAKDPRADLAEGLSDLSPEPLLADGNRCPLVGMDPEEPGLLCCLAYRRPLSRGKLRGFFDSVCAPFRCAAWERLEDREILFAARITGDWFHYSLLINDMGLLRETFRRFGSGEAMSERDVEAVKEILRARLAGSATGSRD